MRENWRTIEGFEAYQVSSFGRVKRIKAGQSTRVGKILKAWPKRGYASVDLSIDGVVTTVRVHKLVAEVFLGPCPVGREVNHIDSNGMNPAVTNLEYVTPSENIKLALRSGRMPTGQHHRRAKLTQDDVHAIRLMYGSGWFTQQALAEAFTVSLTAINFIVRGRTWAYGSHVGCGSTAQLHRRRSRKERAA